MIGQNIQQLVREFQQAVADRDFSRAINLLENEEVENQANADLLVLLLKQVIRSHQNPLGMVNRLLKIGRVRKAIARDLDILDYASNNQAIMSLLLESNEVRQYVSNNSTYQNIHLALVSAIKFGNHEVVATLLKYFKKDISFEYEVGYFKPGIQLREFQDLTSIFKDSQALILKAYKDFASERLQERYYAMAKDMAETGLPKELISIICQYEGHSYTLLSEQESQEAIHAGIKRAMAEIKIQREKEERQRKEEEQERQAKIAREKEERQRKEEEEERQAKKARLNSDFDYAFALYLEQEQDPLLDEVDAVLSDHKSPTNR